MTELTKTAKTFFPLWLKEIVINDVRCTAMPEHFTGTVIGIREDAVLIRRNNNMTDWYMFQNSRITFYEK